MMKKNGTGKTIALNEIKSSEQERIITGDAELNRVLGGGIVPGSLVLVAGEPGIGKSTLFLQNALLMKNITTLYISGEESELQIKLRADRLKIQSDSFYLLTETLTQTIFQEIKKLKPDLVIVDSIQTIQSPYIDSSPGSVSQIRETISGDSTLCQRHEHSCISDRTYHQRWQVLQARKYWSIW